MGAGVKGPCTEDALAAYAARCVADSPLSPSEKSRGLALRVVSCVRAADDDVSSEPTAFVWSVLVLCRPGAPLAAVRLGRLESLVAASAGPAGAVSAEAELLSRARFGLEGEDWEAREYALTVPRQLRLFTVRTKGASCLVGRDRRNGLIRSYFEDIRNAAADAEAYPLWLERHRAWLARQQFPTDGPLVSIVCPAFKTPPDFLRAMLDSLIGQTYRNWELVLVNASPDDGGMRAVLAEYADDRIVVVDCPENKGIAGNTNVGLARCRGEYVCFLDHDDFVEPCALAAMVGAAQASPVPVDLLYCDEDSYDEHGRYAIPLFKPGKNIDLLYSNDYILHWLMVSRRVLDATARSGAEVDGAQDYDLSLKAMEVARGVVRVPYVLYHWRIHAGSTNNNPASKMYAQESGRRAIADHLARRGLNARVERERVLCTYRTDFPLPDDGLPSLRCVVAGEPAASLAGTLDVYRAQGARVELVRLPADAGAGEARRAALAADAEVVLFVSGGLGIDAASLRTALGYFSRSEVAAVSPRVLLANGLVDCAGSIVRPDGSLCKLGRCLPASDEGYIGRLHRPYSSAVLDADCCLVRGASLAGARDWEGYTTLPYALADACLAWFGEGRSNVFTPFACATWEAPRSLLVESPTACPGDARLLAGRNADVLSRGDPSHDPNFDPWSPHYRLRWDCGDRDRE